MIKTELKLIIDVGVSNKVEKWLARQGFDVISVRGLNRKRFQNTIKESLVKGIPYLDFMPI